MLHQQLIDLTGRSAMSKPQDIEAAARELQDAVLRAQKEPGLADLAELMALSREAAEVAEFQNQLQSETIVSFAADSAH